MRSLVPLCAIAVALSACGSDDGGDAVAEEPGTVLTIEFRADETAEPAVSRLECDPAGGDLGDPADACRRLDDLDDPFAPTPGDVACTEIYGGPSTATVSGTLDGEPVDASFSRENGCEIERWDRHAFLLPEAKGAS